MKLRIKDNHIRIRLSIEELESLAEQKNLQMTTEMGDGPMITSIKTTEGAALASLKNGNIAIHLPVQKIKELWANDEEGIDEVVQNSNGSSLQVSLQKDYACIGRSEKANAGLFANPKAENEDC